MNNNLTWFGTITPFESFLLPRSDTTAGLAPNGPLGHTCNLCPYNVSMSREHGGEPRLAQKGLARTGVALAQASGMTAARNRFDRLVMRPELVGAGGGP